MPVAVLGSINMDVVLGVDVLPKPGETISALSKAHYAGGKGANQAIASARSGVSTSMIGAVGSDRFGVQLCKNLSENNIAITAVETLTGADTGQAFINVSKAGENSIVVLPGANKAYKYPKSDPTDLRSASIRLSL